MAPVQEAFAERWPEADCTNLLEDALSLDRARHGEITPDLTARIGLLTDYAIVAGAQGVLFTCSAFGTAIEQAAARSHIPVLKPNEAMFEAALDAGDNIGMLATFAPAVAGMEEEFKALSIRRGRHVARLRTICVPAAMVALREGDTATHNHLLALAAPALRDCDVILLAHFSTARAQAAVMAVVGPRVQTSPGAAVAKLKSLLISEKDTSRTTA